MPGGEPAVAIKGRSRRPRHQGWLRDQLPEIFGTGVPKSEPRLPVWQSLPAKLHWTPRRRRPIGRL